MHGQVSEFLRKAQLLHPQAFEGRIVELGSLDINGNPREFFKASEYVGVDFRKGPNVTDVCLAHEYTGRPPGYFDFALSTEMLEHDPHWEKSVKHMAHLVREGGSLLITCAAPGRPSHDTAASPTPGYYRPVSAVELVGCLNKVASFAMLFVETGADPDDTRLFAHSKTGTPKAAEVPVPAAVEG
jgi:SAM-dependent methyltransferase